MPGTARPALSEQVPAIAGIGGRDAPEWAPGFRRNQWADWIGINARVGQESVGGLPRNMHRRYSPFRRRTNTYAKSVEGLQRVLDCQWVYLNFSRRHFTTKIVPAVGLGVITAGYSIKALLGLQIMG